MVTFADLPYNTPTIRVVQNGTLTAEFIVRKQGSPINLTGYSAVLAAKISIADADTQFTVAGTITSALEGKVQISLSSTETATARTLIAELALTKAGSNLTPIQFYLEIEDAI